VAVKRRYESAHRQEQARQTRRAILDAAAALFVEPGYAATPLTAVAAEAGVAIQTVYKVFGSKQALLSALVDVTVAGDDEPVALSDRQFVAEIRALSDARAKLDRYARHLVDTHARQAQVMLALAAAATADSEAARALPALVRRHRRRSAPHRARIAGARRERFCFHWMMRGRPRVSRFSIERALRRRGPPTPTVPGRRADG
jgi:AcrR family transcriptional regulator